MDLSTESLSDKAKLFIDVVTTKRAGVAAVVFTSLIGPQVLALYRYKPHEWITWDFGRILMFVLSLSVPAVLVHVLILLLVVGPTSWTAEAQRQRVVFAAMALSGAFFYLAHLLILNTKYHSLTAYVQIAYAAQAFYWFVGYFGALTMAIRDRRKRRRDSDLIVSQI